jgi:small subunit ribosomal protein S24e
LIFLHKRPSKYLNGLYGTIPFTLSQEVVMLEDRNNSLLSRREVKALFRGAAGKLKKTDAAEQIASQLGVDKKNVIPINLVCETGMTDVHAVFYVFENEEAAKKQLPRYRMLRTMPKAERKKLLDDEKAAKLKAKQAAAAEAKGGGKK